MHSAKVVSCFTCHILSSTMLHFALHTSHCTLHTPHFTLHAPHFTLHSSHSTLTLHPSSHLSSSHLIPVLLQELACAVRHPDPCVRALCEAVAALLSKNMTCARPRCNATPSKHFPHTSHCALHAPHSTLHTCTSSQLISSELVSSNFMSSHLSAKFFLAIFMSSERGSTFLISPKLVSTHLGSSARQKA